MHIRYNFTDTITVEKLWEIIINTFGYIWNADEIIGNRGDIWVYSPLKITGELGSDLIPFNKLLHWLMYSIIEPLEMYGIYLILRVTIQRGLYWLVVVLKQLEATRTQFRARTCQKPQAEITLKYFSKRTIHLK